MSMSTSSTTRAQMRRVTRYSLPKFLSCRLTTNQRLTEAAHYWLPHFSAHPFLRSLGTDLPLVLIRFSFSTSAECSFSNQ